MILQTGREIESFSAKLQVALLLIFAFTWVIALEIEKSKTAVETIAVRKSVKTKQPIWRGHHIVCRKKCLKETFHRGNQIIVKQLRLNIWSSKCLQTRPHLNKYNYSSEKQNVFKTSLIWQILVNTELTSLKKSIDHTSTGGGDWISVAEFVSIDHTSQGAD